MNKQTRVLITTMSTLVIFAVVFISYHYRYDKQSVDPRVAKANELYAGYNDLAVDADYEGILRLMDTIEAIYNNYPHYSESFEVGVLYNNRAATRITMALASVAPAQKDSLLTIAERDTRKGIEIYNHWLNKWEDKSVDEIKITIVPYFREGEEWLKGKDPGRYIKKRAKQIEEAQLETYRRLSVSHTNMGLIYRHREKYDKAINEYIKALEYWPDNLTAENNMNILLNKPVKKRGILRSIFPKDRKGNR